MTRIIALEPYQIRRDEDAAEDVLRRCRAVIAAYLPADSGISQAEALNLLIEILDEAKAHQFARPDRSRGGR